MHQPLEGGHAGPGTALQGGGGQRLGRLVDALSLLHHNLENIKEH